MAATTAPSLGELYARLRHAGSSHPEAVVELARRSDYDEEQIEAFARREDWRRRYEKVNALAVLDRDEFDVARQVDEIILRYQQAKEVLDAAFELTQSPDATDKTIAAWRTAQLTCNDLRHELGTVEQDLRRRSLEQRTTAESRRRYQEIRGELLHNYGDQGPQYHLLVDLVADAKVKLEEAKASGRDIETGEFSELTKLVLSGINQLQKFTEATKVEAIRREVNEAVLQVIVIAENVLADHPQLFQTFAHAVDSRLIEAGDET